MSSVPWTSPAPLDGRVDTERAAPMQSGLAGIVVGPAARMGGRGGRLAGGAISTVNRPLTSWKGPAVDSQNEQRGVIALPTLELVFDQP